MGNCISSKKIRVKPIKHRKKAIPKSLKKMVWDKYIGANIGTAKCLCCNHQDIRQIEFHCGHVISESSGGYTTLKNLRPICSQCNLSMGTMNMNEFMKQYMEKSMVKISIYKT
jgi:5-methylcytosine-specific restriction endonuclease McrA